MYGWGILIYSACSVIVCFTDNNTFLAFAYPSLSRDSLGGRGIEFNEFGSLRVWLSLTDLSLRKEKISRGVDTSSGWRELIQRSWSEILLGTEKRVSK